MKYSFAALLFASSAMALAQQASPVKQIADGQVQANGAAPVAAAAAPVKQIADGQVQAPASPAPAAPVAAAPAPAAPVKQIADGQLQVPTKAVPAVPVSPATVVPAAPKVSAAPPKTNTTGFTYFTGAATQVSMGKGIVLVAAGVVAGLALL